MDAPANLPLRGRTALVTGASRRRGIGVAIAKHLAALGASVVIHHHVPHDADQSWGADDLELVCDAVRSNVVDGASFSDVGMDLAEPDAPTRLIEHALTLTGTLDVLVCNHARSGRDGTLEQMTSELLDGHWAVDARSTIMLTREFAFSARRPATPHVDEDVPHDEQARGRVVWMTSGQQHGAMPGEVAYAAAKAALAGVTATVATELQEHGIILNTVNPGPVNTGYLDPETADRPQDVIDEVHGSMPFGRFGEPADAARLVAWLATDDARWIVGQVITSDGGFSLR